MLPNFIDPKGSIQKNKGTLEKQSQLQTLHNKHKQLTTKRYTTKEKKTKKVKHKSCPLS